MQHEQLFTELTPAQAETISAAASASVSDFFGSADAFFTRTGPGAFKADFLNVKDRRADGLRVYARFQGLATDNTVLTTPTRRFDEKGAFGGGTVHKNLNGSFSKNIKQLRVVIYRDDPIGTDIAKAGDWQSF